jgi:hypothetical protein
LPQLAGISGKIDVSGKTVISHPGLVQAPTQTVERSPHSARLARPTLAFFSALGFLWLTSSVVVAVAAIIRQLRSDLTAAETILLPVGAVAAVATPAVLWVRYVLREVWPSTPRAVEIGGRLRRTILYSASAYGIAWLFIGVFEGVAYRNGAGFARPGWALTSFIVALTVAVATWVVTRRRR